MLLLPHSTDEETASDSRPVGRVHTAREELGSDSRSNSRHISLFTLTFSQENRTLPLEGQTHLDEKFN